VETEREHRLREIGSSKRNAAYYKVNRILNGKRNSFLRLLVGVLNLLLGGGGGGVGGGSRGGSGGSTESSQRIAQFETTMYT
jgi:hypothetical protein